MAKLGFHPGRMLLDFGSRIEDLIDAFGTQACSNTLWALAVLQVGAAHALLPPACFALLTVLPALAPSVACRDDCASGRPAPVLYRRQLQLGQAHVPCHPGCAWKNRPKSLSTRH